MNRAARVCNFSKRARSSLPQSTPVPEGQATASATRDIGIKYQPSEFQKYILVLTKKYPSKREVPKYVSYDLIERSRSEARIKLANWLMLATFLGSVFCILSGKAAAKRGESVFQINQDFHKKYVDDYEKKETKSQ